MLSNLQFCILKVQNILQIKASDHVMSTNVTNVLTNYINLFSQNVTEMHFYLNTSSRIWMVKKWDKCPTWFVKLALKLAICFSYRLVCLSCFIILSRYWKWKFSRWRLGKWIPYLFTQNFEGFIQELISYRTNVNFSNFQRGYSGQVWSILYGIQTIPFAWYYGVI